MSKSYLSNGTNMHYGVIGEGVGVYAPSYYSDRQQVKVGDIVSFKIQDGDIRSGVVVKNESKVGVMGSMSRSFVEMKDLQIIISHEFLTEDITYNLHNLNIIKPKQMTLKEIEEKLGYPIEIMEG